MRRSRCYQKEKEQSRLSRVPDYEGRESQGGRERRDQSGSMKRKGWTPRSRKAYSTEEKEGKQEEPP